MNRRDFLAGSLAAAAINGVGRTESFGQQNGERPQQDENVRVLNPRGRVPVSFIIDDSTCLVNLAHYGIPHFTEAFPKRYKQDWRKLPREIPDSFVRKFGQWCREHGVKGKYSVVPYPACVGWVDRDMPGWTRKELQDSIALVRDFMAPDWDIHPEMITHTFVINTKTGRPYPDRTEKFMENFGWSVGKSADELADYLAYALKILRNAGFQCEGVTTPGGFGNKSLEALSLATLQSCRDVFKTEIPHYFRHLYTDDRSVVPRVENVRGLKTDDPRCVVSIIGCTGDWFGGWDGLELGSSDQFITSDLKTGRMVDVIERGEPAIMVCHWPGIYFNGEEHGFNIFKNVVGRLHDRYDNLIWMKLSEIARYWAAKELTEIRMDGDTYVLRAPFACDGFTIETKASGPRPPVVIAGDDEIVGLKEINDPLKLVSGTFVRTQGKTTMCFDLRKGTNRITASTP